MVFKQYTLPFPLVAKFRLHPCSTCAHIHNQDWRMNIYSGKDYSADFLSHPCTMVSPGFLSYMGNHNKAYNKECSLGVAFSSYQQL